MTNESNGLMVSDDDGVYFIPGDQLAQFKLSDEAAVQVDESMGGEVTGFAKSSFEPAKFAFMGDFKPIPLRNSYADAPVATKK